MILKLAKLLIAKKIPKGLSEASSVEAVHIARPADEKTTVKLQSPIRLING